jgi:TPR repeat protein
MSILPRWRDFGLRRERADEAALHQRVTALQAALENCKGAARRWTELRWGLVSAIAAVALAAGFMLGVYSGPLMQALGFGAPAQDAAAANAAYQKGSYAAALQVARPLADQGDARAQSLLGLIYYNGRGVPKDEPMAVTWFRRAADQGDVSAQFYLGNLYTEGKGVPQDSAEAAKWYRRAADQGDALAQYNLGVWYAKGEGGSQDYVSAHMWFNLAAARLPASDARNRIAATNNRDAVAGKMTPEQIAEAQKLAREWHKK